MAKMSNVFFMLVIFAATAAFLIEDVKAVDCENDWKTLADKCIDFVRVGTPPTTPSTECCDIIKKIDFPCACAHVTPEIEKQISMTNAVAAASTCGRPLPHGMKCGSYTVPAGSRGN